LGKYAIIKSWAGKRWGLTPLARQEA
jgi:hypothetical protein